jgi:hypothetical protein
MPVISGMVQSDVRSNANESLVVSQMEAPAHDRTRAGRSFLMVCSGQNFGGFVALPTTGASGVIWNQDPAKTYYFEELGFWLTTATTSPGPGILMVAFMKTPVPAVSNANPVITSASNSGAQSKMLVVGSTTITQPTAPNWYTIGQNFSTSSTIFPGSVFFENRNIQGAIALPPNQGLAFAMVSSTGGSKMGFFARWYELESDLE